MSERERVSGCGSFELYRVRGYGLRADWLELWYAGGFMADAAETPEGLASLSEELKDIEVSVYALRGVLDGMSEEVARAAGEERAG